MRNYFWTGCLFWAFGICSALALDSSATAAPSAAWVRAVVVDTNTHDLAVVKVKISKRITFKPTVLSVVKPVTVQIQNRGGHDEPIPDLATLGNLVKLSVISLGSCPSPVAVLRPPKVLPFTLSPNRKLTVVFDVTYSCSRDPLKGVGHEDYRYVTTVSHPALDGNADSVVGNDVCPRSASGTDKGCADLLTDVIGTGAVVLNRTPQPVADAANATSGNPVDINVLVNDTDPDGDSVGVVGFTQPAHGALSFFLDVATYTPNILFTGTDNFSYTITDSRGGTNTANVAVTVTPPPFKVTSHAPAANASEVGAHVRPQVFFSKAVNPATLNTNNFYATALGQKLTATIIPGGNGLFAWLFFNPPMPGATEIAVTMDGSSIQSATGETLDADGDGTPGGVLSFHFSTVSLAPIPGTVLIGRLVDPGPDLRPMTADDFNPGLDGQPMTSDDVFLLPIAGVKIYILGMEDHTVVTDANGDFALAPVPAGDVKVVMDGLTATSPPAGQYFPEMVMDSHQQAGLTNTVMPGMTTMYLPRVASTILQTVNNGGTTMVTLKPEGAYDLTAEQQAFLNVQILPNSLIGTNGQPASSAQIGISVVPPELVEGMLPPGLLQHTFDITIQSMGASLFATPAPMTFPNVFNAAPGTKLNFLSFDHTTGLLVIEGTATVSADGLSVHTDPGTGITHPGWHGLTPPGANGSGGGGGPPPPRPKCPGCPPPAKPKNCDTERNLAISAGVQCAAEIATSIPKSTPLVGCAIGAGLNALGAIADCNIDSAGCNKAIGGGIAGTLLGCIPIVGGIGGAAWQCGLQAGTALIDYNGCLEVAGAAPAALATAQISENIFLEQQALWAAAADMYAIVLGDPKWTVIDPAELLTAQAIFQALQDSLQPTSPGGERIIPSEHDAILQLPLPGNITALDVNQLLDRIDQMMSGQVPTGGLDLNALAAAASNLTEVATILQSRGWKTTYDGYIRGSTALAAQQDLALGAVGVGSLVQANLAAEETEPEPLLVARAFYKLTNVFDGFVQRGRMPESGSFDQLFVAADSMFTLGYVDPVSGRVAFTVFFSRASGSSFTIPRAIFVESSSPDTDGDGLSDEAEDIIGTDPAQFSTCGDGISDLARVQQDLNLASCLPPPTGIIAALPLPGEAKEVVLVGSTSSASEQTAYVACGTGGLSIVNASNFQMPILLGQLNLAGDATDVAVDANLQIAAVAANAGGLHLVDVSDPMQPTLLRTINAAANQVEVLDGIAYATFGLALSSYDLLTGAQLDTLTFGGANLTSLAREGVFLYTMNGGDVLRAIDISGPLLIDRGSLTMPNRGGKLFVGGRIAYVPAGENQPGLFQGGFATVNVYDPDALTLLSGVDDIAIAGTLAAANGSGLGLLLGTLNSPIPGQPVIEVLDVVDVSDPSNTGAFLTRFFLPASPSSVAIGSGIAFVADGTAGLQVVNYAPFDNQGVAPVVSISVSSTNAIEGSLQPVQVQISDDVQVRSVELLVNGQVVLNDVSFPFDLTAALPLLAAGSNTVVIQVRATDTGGNVGLSNPITIQLVADNSVLTILSIDPANNTSRSPGFRAVKILFSEPVDQATVTAASIQLMSANGPVSPQNIQFRLNGTTVQFTYPLLAVGDYEIIISGPAVKDRAGNALSSTNVISTFAIQQMGVPIVWGNPAGGFWDDPANWVGGVLPGPTNDVLIAVPGNAPIVFRQGTSQIQSLVSSNAFIMTGGTLTVGTTIQVDNTFTISGGRLAGATILPGGGGAITITNVNVVTVLDGVTLARDLTVVGTTFLLRIEHGLTLIGATLTLDTSNSANTYLYFFGSQTLGGSGEVVVVGNGFSQLIANEDSPPQGPVVLVIGPDITIHGGAATITRSSNASVVNQGTIIADTSGQPINFTDPTFSGKVINQGTLKAVNGGLLRSHGLENTGAISVGAGSSLQLGVNLESNSWNNAGTIDATNATVYLSGTFTLAKLGTFHRSGGDVFIVGTLDITGTNLALNATAGSWSLYAGTLKGGTLTTTGGATLLFAAGFVPMLDGVTLASDLTWDAGATGVNVKNGLTLNNVTFTATGPVNRQLTFQGTQTLGGTGQVLLASSANSLFTSGQGAQPGATLTIGAGITITETGNGTIAPGSQFDTLLNEGTIQALSGGKFSVGAGTFINAGQLTPGNPPQLLNLTESATFTQQVAGVLNIHIGGTTPGTGFSHMKVTAGVGLDGALNLTLINGFDPNLGDTFEIMTFASRTGQFATINGLTFAVGKQFLATYTPTNLTLQVVAAAPIARASASSPQAVDTDGDGMSDAFELESGLNPHDSRDAQLDSDGDGLTNLEEFQLGADPLNPDREPPAVLAVIASAGNTKMPVNNSIGILFSEAILPGSVTKASVQVIRAGTTTEGTVTVAENQMSAIFRPATNLSADAQYEGTITGVRDLAGNALVGPVPFTFETSDQPDQAAPVLVGVTSVSAATPMDTVIVEFDEPLDPTLITERTIRLVDPATDAAVAGTIRISEDGREVIFVPSAPPPANTEYCLILDCLADLAGNCAESTPPLCLTTGN